MTSANIEAARRWTAAFNARDLDALQELVTDDIELVPIRAAMEDVRYVGRDSLADWLRDLEETWSELQIELHEVTEPVPGTVLVLGRMVARSRADIPVEADAGWVARMIGGRAASIDTYLDPQAAVRAATGES